MRVEKERLRALTIVDTEADAAAPARIVQKGHEGIDVTFAGIAPDDLGALNDTEALENERKAHERFERADGLLTSRSLNG